MTTIGKCTVCGGVAIVSEALLHTTGRTSWVHLDRADWQDSPHNVEIEVAES